MDSVIKIYILDVSDDFVELGIVLRTNAYWKFFTLRAKEKWSVSILDNQPQDSNLLGSLQRSKDMDKLMGKLLE
jgi:hypothetical protein